MIEALPRYCLPFAEALQLSFLSDTFRAWFSPGGYHFKNAKSI